MRLMPALMRRNFHYVALAMGVGLMIYTAALGIIAVYRG